MFANIYLKIDLTSMRYMIMRDHSYEWISSKHTRWVFS